ncbi:MULTISPECIES: hypothetical protein [Niastella]|uniref:Uncharacterized protein n=1 Tax=Niastella soli TaxID=2821487 RepID=A0ABS3Z0Q8_9BACT|nr:hypothetical protein [Niastella soli]MBO9203608.1 hypothetical protein [Niastella soli]
MKKASIYILKEKIIIHPESKANAGFWLSDEHVVILPVNASPEEIINGINESLSKSRMGLPDPKDWSSFDKQLLANMGLKSWAPIKRKSTKYCSVECDNNVIVFIPTAHDTGNSGAGFTFKTSDAVKVINSVDNNELFKAFKLALEKCE